MATLFFQHNRNPNLWKLVDSETGKFVLVKATPEEIQQVMAESEALSKLLEKSA